MGATCAEQGRLGTQSERFVCQVGAPGRVQQTFSIVQMATTLRLVPSDMDRDPLGLIFLCFPMNFPRQTNLRLVRLVVF